MKIIIIGGSGGIGLAIVKKFLENYPDAEITATFLSCTPSLIHPKLQWQCLDVRNEEEIKKFSEDFHSIDILINAVGFLYSSAHRPEKSINEFDVDFYNLNIALNTSFVSKISGSFLAIETIGFSRFKAVGYTRDKR